MFKTSTKRHSFRKVAIEKKYIPSEKRTLKTLTIDYGWDEEKKYLVI